MNAFDDAFEDDFIDDDEGCSEHEETETEEPKEESEKPQIAELAEEDDQNTSVLPPEVIKDMNDVFSRSEKLDTLNLSLKIANSVTNQLYSLLFCVNQDCGLLVSRNRTSCPVNIQSEVIKANIPEVKFENGIICHKKFVDGFNCHLIKNDKEQQNLYDYLELCRNSLGKALPPTVENACQILKDPLVRSHNTLRALKQKISDLKKSNNELSVQTRHTANRLVKLSKTEGKNTLEPTSNKSDVIIQQQRLQKILTRVYNLRESNDATTASNNELTAKLSTESGRVPKDTEIKLSEKVIFLQKKVAELTASIEQGEEDRETVMAQRRVSMTRMNAAVDKVGHEIQRFEALIQDVENKLRIMTQGKSASSASEKKPTAAAARAPVKAQGGSKIPVLQPKSK